MKKRWEIGRRAFLGGVGATIALPVLDVMHPSIARAQSAGDAARRLIFLYVPNGFHMPGIVPTTSGPGYALPPILEPLAAHVADFNIISGLDNYAATQQGDGAGDHARGTASFLTARHITKTSGANIRNGVSVDQVAAQQIGARTRFSSLELGVEGGGTSGSCDSGYSCAYTRNISWTGESTPAAKEVSPRLVFERLFEGSDPNLTARQAARRRTYRASILDFVKDDTQRTATRLGVADKRKLDEYLTGLRQLERRIESSEEQQCEAGEAPLDTADREELIAQMWDLMVVAMRCDVTRVMSFMMANAGDNRAYPELGVNSGHHELSHHQDNPTKQGLLERINIWETQQLAGLLARMSAVQEDSGTLLDNSLVFFSSECADGNAHMHMGMPAVVAGAGGGAISTGRHIALGGRPIANLFISMLDNVGVHVDTFGDDGDGPLSEL